MAKIKAPREEKQFYNLFARYVDDDGVIHDSEFGHDIDELRKLPNITEATYEDVEVLDDGSVNALEIPSPLTKLMLKYELPLQMEEFMSHFVVSGKIDPSKLKSGVYILDEDSLEASGPNKDAHQNFQDYIRDTRYAKYTHLTLAIPVTATNTQITKVLAEQKKFIKDKQSRVSGTPLARIRKRKKAKRDSRIIELSNAGKRPAEIAKILAEEYDDVLTNYDVSRIKIKRRRKK